jgi:hypothetical protein
MGNKAFDDLAIVLMKFRMQLEILSASHFRFDSSLADIKSILQADLFDSELDAARELMKNGFLRGAGAVAGVVLERHLGQVCDAHRLTSRKRNPAIPSLSFWLFCSAKLICRSISIFVPKAMSFSRSSLYFSRLEVIAVPSWGNPRRDLFQGLTVTTPALPPARACRGGSARG